MKLDPESPRDPWARPEPRGPVGLHVYGVVLEGQNGNRFFTTVFAFNAAAAIRKAMGGFKRSSNKSHYGKLETEHGTYHAFIMA